MIFNGETFRNYFISLSAYSLIIWLVRSPKNLKKKYQFWKYDCWFLLRCQNSLRYELSLFLTEVSFEASEENQLSYFQNGYFFKILWWSHEPHNKGICRWKNEIISECFTINNHGFSFVSFLIDQTLIQWIVLL